MKTAACAPTLSKPGPLLNHREEKTSFQQKTSLAGDGLGPLAQHTLHTAELAQTWPFPAGASNRARGCSQPWDIPGFSHQQDVTPTKALLEDTATSQHRKTGQFKDFQPKLCLNIKSVRMERNEFWNSALPSSLTCLGTGHPRAPAAVPGPVPDFPPALQVLLGHHHHGPSVQVHLILVSCSVGVNHRVLLLCWKGRAASLRSCLMEAWPQLNNGYEVLHTNDNFCNLAANTQRYTTFKG